MFGVAGIIIFCAGVSAHCPRFSPAPPKGGEGRGEAADYSFLPARAACAGGPTCVSVRTGSHDLAGATQRRDQSAIWNLKAQIE